MEFNTTQFQFSHGRTPRGEGAWAFSDKRSPEPSEVFWANGSFTEAKKAAAQHFAGKTRVVFVQP